MNGIVNSPEILQIVRITGFEKIPGPVVYDQNGKAACYNYFQQALKILKYHQYIYYPNSNFKRHESFEYEERFLKIQSDILVEVGGIDDCHFY